MLKPDGPMRKMVAEGVVIVASILLAFALDAWWDSVQRNREIRTTLLALAEEFAEVPAEMERASQRAQRALTAADTILSILRSGQESVPVRYLGDLFRTPSSTPKQGALTAVLASGRLGLLPSQELQALLAGWPALLEDLNEDEGYSIRFVWEQLLPYMSRFDGAAQSLYVRQGEEVAGSVSLPLTPETVNIVEARRFFAVGVLDEYERLQIDQVLSEIRRSIQSHLN